MRAAEKRGSVREWKLMIVCCGKGEERKRKETIRLDKERRKEVRENDYKKLEKIDRYKMVKRDVKMYEVRDEREG